MDKGYRRPGFLNWDKAKENLRKLLDAEGIPEAARDGVTFNCAEFDKDIGFVFPMLWPKFFEVALGKKGTPQSFVYLDACFSADSPALAHAFNAKAFIGSTSTVAGWATARFARYIFSNMIHRGHSVREAMDRLRNLCKGAYVIYLEDSILSPVARGDVDLAVESEHLQSWGIDQKPYDRISNEIFSLIRMARWANKDVNNGAESLGRCFDLFWKTPGKRPGLGETFCTQGLIGAYTPTGPDVEDARHLVSGHPSKPIGRFVIR